MLSGTSTASASSPLASPIDTSPARPSSMTCVSSYSPVLPRNIGELRTWLRQAFPVNRSAFQESSSELQTNETCGPQRGTLFASFDQRTFSWKTSQASLLADTPESLSPSWPNWGMWEGGDAYQLPTPVQSIDASDGGSWPTPTVAMHKGSSLGALTRISGRSRHRDRLDYAVEGDAKSGRLNPQWVEWLMGWPEGWTELRPLGTDKFQEWSLAHGRS